MTGGEAGDSDDSELKRGGPTSGSVTIWGDALETAFADQGAGEDTSPKTWTVNGYEVTPGLLGKGGQGLVYRASRSGGKVLLKFLPSAAQLREYHAAEHFRKSSPGRVVLATSMGTWQTSRGAFPYLVFRDEGGTNLGDWLPGTSRLWDLLTIHIDIAQGASELAAAHYAHLDIKPGNVIVLPNGRAKLIDLGAVRRTQPPTANASSPRPDPCAGVHTFPFQAPEEVARTTGRPSSKADVYSIGVTLAECLKDLPRWTAGEASGIDLAINTLVNKACCFNASGRYHDANELRRALESLREKARRPKARTRWWRRFLVAAVLLFCAAAGLFLAMVRWPVLTWDGRRDQEPPQDVHPNPTPGPDSKDAGLDEAGPPPRPKASTLYGEEATALPTELGNSIRAALPAESTIKWVTPFANGDVGEPAQVGVIYLTSELNTLRYHAMILSRRPAGGYQQGEDVQISETVMPSAELKPIFARDDGLLEGPLAGSYIRRDLDDDGADDHVFGLFAPAKGADAKGHLAAANLLILLSRGRATSVRPKTQTDGWQESRFCLVSVLGAQSSLGAVILTTFSSGREVATGRFLAPSPIEPENKAFSHAKNIYAKAERVDGVRSMKCDASGDVAVRVRELRHPNGGSFLEPAPGRHANYRRFCGEVDSDACYVRLTGFTMAKPTPAAMTMDPSWAMLPALM